jgi:hypothetical protein
VEGLHRATALPTFAGASRLSRLSANGCEFFLHINNACATDVEEANCGDGCETLTDEEEFGVAFVTKFSLLLLLLLMRLREMSLSLVTVVSLMSMSSILISLKLVSLLLLLAALSVEEVEEPLFWSIGSQLISLLFRPLFR